MTRNPLQCRRGVVIRWGAAWLLVAATASADGSKWKLPTRLSPSGRIEHPEVDESSGLARSRKVPGRFWTHNDSGGAPRLYAMDADGKPVGNPVRIKGARNVDWEDIAVDDRGQIWIADTGNNRNRRKDLRLLVVEEPGEEIPDALPVLKTIAIAYPDQHAFPPEKMNFDCEALVVRDGVPYLLTKHRSDLDSKLYRVEEREDGDHHVILVDRLPNLGMVTGADLHPDGKRLAVVTFTGVALFEFAPEGRLRPDRRFIWRFPLGGLRQCEAICWLDGETLLIGNEQRDLFQLPAREITGEEAP